MGFLKWMEERPKIVKILLCLVSGWRAYALVRKILEKKEFVKEIVFAVFSSVFSILDFFLIIFKGLQFGVEDLESGKVVDA